MRKGFTLVELLVVIGMLAVLMGALTSGVNQARRRSQVAKATQDVKEMTNAILAFEKIAVGRSLEKYETAWTVANESSLRMILGGEKTESGENSPVLYNAQLRNGTIVDPWGEPYEFQIRKVTGLPKKLDNFQYMTAPVIPNFNRLSDEERQ